LNDAKSRIKQIVDAVEQALPNHVVSVALYSNYLWSPLNVIEVAVRMETEPL
jgi:hypothetical protein